MKDFEKEISEFLNDAHGEVKIKVDGMNTHLDGKMNKAGIAMAAYTLLYTISETEKQPFTYMTEMMDEMYQILKSDINGKMPERKKHGCKDN